jgi:hypothetical protein
MAETSKPSADQRQTVTVGGHELEVTPPTPTQEEADAMKEQALGPAPEPVAGETAQQKREREQREQQQREAKPAAPASQYQTR